MRRLALALVGFAYFVTGCVQTQIRHVSEGACMIDLPASWCREEVQGIDSSLVRYRGDGFLCEIEFGRDLRGQRHRQIMTDSGDHNVAYVGFRHDTLLFVPTESGYVTVRVFHRDLSDRAAALRILQSVTIKEQPNQALQPTTMSVTDRADARSAPATVVADL